MNLARYFRHSSVHVVIAASLMLSAAFTAASHAQSSDVGAVYLRADSLVDPVMAPSVAPRLSWGVEAEGYNRAQTAYRIIVSSTTEGAEAGEGDLWDSGRVESDDSLHAQYAGEALHPMQRVYWRVKLWDEQDEEGQWSDVAMFGAPLRNEAWTNDMWIGLDELPRDDGGPALDFADASWISSRENVREARAGKITLGTTFQVPAGSEVRRAWMWLAADDSFELSMNGDTQQGGGDWQEASLVDVSDDVRVGRNVLRVRLTNDTDGPVGLLGCLYIELSNGETLQVTTGEGWTIGSPEDRRWERPGRNERAAFVVSPQANSPIWRDRVRGPGESSLEPVRYLRTDFESEGGVIRATLYLTCLGFTDAYINGERVTTHFISDWTDYRARVFSYGFDVTDHIQRGNNAMGLTLADGWFSGHIASFGNNRWGHKNRVAAQLIIEHADGSMQAVKTGDDWRAHVGPILVSDMIMGETHDARITRTDGFSEPGFDDAAWHAVAVGSDEVDPVVEPTPHVLMDAFEEFETVRVTEPERGVYVFDMGQNFAGVVRLRVRGEAGQQIRLRYAERLNPDGTLYTENLRGARATDYYTCAGNGVAEWQPRYTFHGFQYVEITGLDYRPQAADVMGVAIGSLTPVVGHFECSSDMLNQLAGNVYWTQRSNFISIPTDCPQRDERLGWTGDAQAYVRTSGLWCDVQTFFGKWMVDVSDGTPGNGNPPPNAPHRGQRRDGGPGWADAVTICPWAVYQMYEDVAILERQYEDMKAYVDFTANRSTDDRLPPGSFRAYGDWLNLDDDTPKPVIYMVYWAQSTRLTAQAARILGHDDEAEHYEQLLSEIIAAFNREFVDEQGCVSGDSQTAYVLALAYDMIEGERFEQAAEHLIRKLRDRNWHLSTGFLGTKDIMHVLTKIGRADIAYRLMMNETYPSWGFSVRNGATTVWEHWNSWTPEDGFQEPKMNSFSHYAYGAVYQWMVENIGGIQLVEPGYRSFRVAPVIGGGLTHASVGVNTVRGQIESNWQVRGNVLTMRVVVPANTRCEVIVPTDDVDSIRVNGERMDTVNIEGLRADGQAISVGSGVYEIRARRYQ